MYLTLISVWPHMFVHRFRFLSDLTTPQSHFVHVCVNNECERGWQNLNKHDKVRRKLTETDTQLRKL